ncbi:DUF2992 family protein [Paenibacillus sp. 8b26]
MDSSYSSSQEVNPKRLARKAEDEEKSNDVSSYAQEALKLE